MAYVHESNERYPYLLSYRSSSMSRRPSTAIGFPAALFLLRWEDEGLEERSLIGNVRRLCSVWGGGGSQHSHRS